jgi:hypothetical protein
MASGSWQVSFTYSIRNISSWSITVREQLEEGVETLRVNIWLREDLIEINVNDAH